MRVREINIAFLVLLVNYLAGIKSFIKLIMGLSGSTIFTKFLLITLYPERRYFTLVGKQRRIAIFFHYLEHYEGDDYYKYRIGEYRALIDVDFKNKILKVQVLDKRSVIYKRRR